METQQQPLYLMQFEAHSDCRSHHLLQEVEVSKHPLIFCGDAKVSFKQGVEAIQERLQALVVDGRGLWEKEE